MFIKGYTPWNKGKPMSEEQKVKISKAEKGKYVSEETKKKISENHKGMSGLKHSEETKRKIGLANKGKTGIKGRIFSKEHRRKLSLSRKGKRQLPLSFFRKIGLLSVEKQNYMKGPTSIEKKVYEELKRRGLLFETQKLIEGKFLVDAYIPSLNLIIEADGDYWHSLPKIISRDKSKNAYLKKCGYKLLRLSETEINNGSFINKLN